MALDFVDWLGQIFNLCYKSNPTQRRLDVWPIKGSEVPCTGFSARGMPIPDKVSLWMGVHTTCANTQCPLESSLDISKFVAKT